MFLRTIADDYVSFYVLSYVCPIVDIPLWTDALDIQHRGYSSCARVHVQQAHATYVAGRMHVNTIQHELEDSYTHHRDANQGLKV
jgi:hypothetical protein